MASMSSNSGSNGEHGHPRRPSLRSSLDDMVGDVDPALRATLAHETAAVVVRAGRDTADPETTSRVMGLAEELGLEALADLWRTSPPDSLPGTLWCLYLLRTWLNRDGDEVGRLYQAGNRAAEVSHVVAGVAQPYGPTEMDELGRAVLSSAFDGDFGVALERAAAFCRVLALGRVDAAHDADDANPELASQQTRLAEGHVRMAEQLEHAAKLWRTGDLG